MNKRCVFSLFLNTVLVMCIMKISSKGELELVGLMRQENGFFHGLHCVTTGPESFTEEGGERQLTHFVFVNGRCILFIDAGTRVHLLDTKGLSFTQNILICIIVYDIYEFGGSVVKYNGLLCLENICSCLF